MNMRHLLVGVFDLLLTAGCSTSLAGRSLLSDAGADWSTVTDLLAREYQARRANVRQRGEQARSRMDVAPGRLAPTDTDQERRR
jgi:hypothetical protein